MLGAEGSELNEDNSTQIQELRHGVVHNAGTGLIGPRFYYPNWKYEEGEKL